MGAIEFPLLLLLLLLLLLNSAIDALQRPLHLGRERVKAATAKHSQTFRHSDKNLTRCNDASHFTRERELGRKKTKWN